LSPVLTRSLIMLGIIVAVVLIVRMNPSLFQDDIHLELDAPSRVTVSDGPAEFVITARLINNTNEPVHLTVESDCKVLQWFVLDGNGSFVEAGIREDCNDLPASQILQPDHFTSYAHTIRLDTSRYVARKRYRLHYRFWGHEDVHRFSTR
jgi:hypothetical protein